MRFGTSLPCVTPVGTPPWPNEDVVKGVEAVARKADELGFAYVTCCDHPIIPKEAAPFMGARWFDPIATLGYVAGMTSRVRLLTSVVVLPYRSPFDIAKSMGTLDALSNGRVIFGVGVGHLEREFETLKASYAERGAVTDEQIQVIKALWGNDSASFHGKHWDFEGLMVAPRPAAQPHPPIWIGGNSKLAVRRAVLHGQGWHPFQITPTQYRARFEYAQQVAREIGRTEPLDFNAPVSRVAPGAVSHQSPRGQRELPTHERSSGEKEPFYVRQATSRPPNPPLTTVEEVSQRIQEFADAGANSINVGLRYRELSPLLEAMDWFAKEVMPRFR